MKDAQEKERFIELRAEGRPYADIAVALDTSKQTLVAWGKELQKEVANARTLRLDALFEQYAVSKARRVEAIGKLREAILKELDKRDLSNVPTVALLKLLLEFGDRLKGEDETLTIQGRERSAMEVLIDTENKTVAETWPV